METHELACVTTHPKIGKTQSELSVSLMEDFQANEKPSQGKQSFDTFKIICKV